MRNKDTVMYCAVATHTGGVDRNMQVSQNRLQGCTSPPTRVAWIETKRLQTMSEKEFVATHTGGVDRNK